VVAASAEFGAGEDRVVVAITRFGGEEIFGLLDIGPKFEAEFRKMMGERLRRQSGVVVKFLECDGACFQSGKEQTAEDTEAVDQRRFEFMVLQTPAFSTASATA